MKAPVLDASLTYRIVVADNHWGKGATMAEAKEAYRKARGKPFPSLRVSRDKATPGSVFAATPSTTINGLGGFNYRLKDLPPVNITQWPALYEPKQVKCEAGEAPRGTCEFGPYGWRGVVQCKFCKQAPPDERR